MDLRHTHAKKKKSRFAGCWCHDDFHGKISLSQQVSRPRGRPAGRPASKSSEISRIFLTLRFSFSPFHNELMVSTARHCVICSKYTGGRFKFPSSTISHSTGTLRRHMGAGTDSPQAVQAIDVLVSRWTELEKCNRIFRTYITKRLLISIRESR